MARAGWKRGPHHVELTLIGHAPSRPRFLANATQQAAGIDRTGPIGDAIATWRGTWTRHARTRAARVAPQRSATSARTIAAGAEPPAAARPRTSRRPSPTIRRSPRSLRRHRRQRSVPRTSRTARSRSASSRAAAPACSPTSSAIARPMTADVAHRLGAHVLRAGATLEDTRLVDDRAVHRRRADRSLFPRPPRSHQRVLRRRVLPHDAGEPCAYVDRRRELRLPHALHRRLRRGHVHGSAPRHPRRRRPALGADVGRHRSSTSRTSSRRASALAGTCSATAARACGRASAAASSMLPGRASGRRSIRRDATVDDVEFGARRPSRTLDAGRAYRRSRPGIEPIAQDEVTTGHRGRRSRKRRALDGLGAGPLAPPRLRDRHRSDGRGSTTRAGPATLPATRDDRAARARGRRSHRPGR